MYLKGCLLKVYELSVPEGYEWIVRQIRGNGRRVRRSSGISQADTWQPVSVELIESDDEGNRRAYADCPWLGNHMLVFRRPARQRVEAAIGEFGEFLPLLCEQADLDLFNVLTVVDALDEEASQVVRFDSSGRIMTIERHEFHREKLPERAIFRVPEAPETIFYTDTMADEFDSFELRGLCGEVIWQA